MHYCPATKKSCGKVPPPLSPSNPSQRYGIECYNTVSILYARLKSLTVILSAILIPSVKYMSRAL